MSNEQKKPAYQFATVHLVDVKILHSTGERAGHVVYIFSCQLDEHVFMVKTTSNFSKTFLSSLRFQTNFTSGNNKLEGPDAIVNQLVNPCVQSQACGVTIQLVKMLK